jgi:type VI secretion system protein ImpK
MKTIGNPLVTGLPDLCADLFSFCLQLQRSKDPGDPEQLRMRFDELFRALETRARQSEVPEPNVALAKYAIVAFVDEMILTSDWTAVKDVWAGRPLQLEYFNEFAAGENFFEKLATLRNTEDSKKIDVLEVYYTCLALGFKGMHGDLSGMEKLKLLIESIGREIRKARSGKTEDNTLSEAWNPPDAVPALVKRFPAWVIAAICGALLLILFLVLTFLLEGSVRSVNEALGS